MKSNERIGAGRGWLHRLVRSFTRLYKWSSRWAFDCRKRKGFRLLELCYLLIAPLYLVAKILILRLKLAYSRFRLSKALLRQRVLLLERRKLLLQKGYMLGLYGCGAVLVQPTLKPTERIHRPNEKEISREDESATAQHIEGV